MHRPVLYEITATIQNAAIAQKWVEWMQQEHIAEVVRAGATSGRLIHLDGDAIRYVVQYEFRSRQAFEQYLRDHAPRLRAEGAARFSSNEVAYERRTGEYLVS